MVENSSLKKARAENFITKFAQFITTPAVCHPALWYLPFYHRWCWAGGWLTWISRALTFLVISCPCALVISIPLSFFGGIGGASRCGILIKGGNYLEALANTSIAVFDKTGTLTKRFCRQPGQPGQRLHRKRVAGTGCFGRKLFQSSHQQESARTAASWMPAVRPMLRKLLATVSALWWTAMWCWQATPA